MAAKLGLKQQQRQRRHQQQHSCKSDRQQVKPKNRQQHHQRAQRSRNDRARRVEFQIDQQRPAHQHQQGDIRIHQPTQQAIAQRGPQHFNPRPGKMKRLL